MKDQKHHESGSDDRNDNEDQGGAREGGSLVRWPCRRFHPRL